MTVKQFFFIIILALFTYSCATTKDRKLDTTSTTDSSDTLRIANDELEYEIIIIEPGFNNWLVTQRPRGYYNQQFLEIRNRQYVIEYNQRVVQPQRFDPNLYIQQINYDQYTDYGYEVNYLLYNYFLFFERQYKQRFFVSRG
ncbi:hypothetical protein SAMN04487910_0867 [Aquimarina amphilecti]|uniref:Lipoprotein n=1 Tax=Aquimarina amphilecti TaxID=1038014 RepID=A0A1H7I5P3_AQUAM|nr:DUF6146 family protein [Aquimarina amphilecti]SEK57861.1 hypothetical protein SAMN04487910_0867 [Aquimarina amphilecti]